MKINQIINEELARLKLQNESLRMVLALATVSVKANISREKLIELLESAKNDLRKLDQNVVIH